MDIACRAAPTIYNARAKGARPPSTLGRSSLLDAATCGFSVNPLVEYKHLLDPSDRPGMRGDLGLAEPDADAGDSDPCDF